MSWKSTLILTSTLFLTMLVAGGGSAYIGYQMGEEALKGVTQPDVNSNQRLKKDRVIGKYKGLKLISEREILVNVYNLTHKNTKFNNTSPEKKTAKSKQLINFKQPQETTPFVPIRDEVEGVSMEIVEAQQQGNSLLLNVTIRNESSKSVRFLYSFLDVRDDRGRALSAISDGLPGELPANGEEFRGTLRIPTVLLDNAQKISVTLTDYPEQKLELKLKDIPVTR
ncbi:MAG: hypothetical protein QNJ34_13650 [Xenococcaceae cyanobacterium MO_188.B29]|nr:hypothetical protein [Xenococcaceae cyanobacterium MO_188.B29]